MSPVTHEDAMRDVALAVAAVGKAAEEFTAAVGRFLAASQGRPQYSRPPATPAVTERPGRQVADSVGVSSSTAPAGTASSSAASLETRLWTPARNEVLRRDYPANVPVPVILERLNALPGREIPRRGVAIQAAHKLLRRPSPVAARIQQSAATECRSVQAATKPTAAISAEKQDWELAVEAAAAARNEVRPATAAPEAIAAKPMPMWSPERLRFAEPMYLAGADITDILIRVNALPGPKVTTLQVQTAAAARFWRRGAADGPTIDQTGPVSTEPLAASFDQIAQWGAERCIPTSGKKLPLAEINAKRCQFGMRPFALIEIARGRVG